MLAIVRRQLKHHPAVSLVVEHYGKKIRETFLV